MNAILSIRGVSVTFGGLKALDSVSLDVQAREVLAVIGPNGAGKSTLLNAISGGVRRATGEILLDGKPLATRAMDVARQGLARSFQHPRLLLEHSVRENLLLGLLSQEPHPIASRMGLVRSSIDDADPSILSVAQAFQLTALLDTRCGHLPYGTQKLIDIARAFVGQPRVVLLDEPSSGLDNKETERFGRLIRTIASQRQLTLLLVEHDMELVRMLGNRVVALEAGAVVAQGPTAEVLDSLGLARRLMGIGTGDKPLAQVGAA